MATTYCPWLIADLCILQVGPYIFQPIFDHPSLFYEYFDLILRGLLEGWTIEDLVCWMATIYVIWASLKNKGIYIHTHTGLFEEKKIGVEWQQFNTCLNLENKGVNIPSPLTSDLSSFSLLHSTSPKYFSQFALKLSTKHTPSGFPSYLFLSHSAAFSRGGGRAYMLKM